MTIGQMAIIGNKKKPQKTPFYYCNKCEYITHNKYNFNKHILTLKHKSAMIGNKKPQKTPKNPKNIQHVYECDDCCFITVNKKDYEKHILTPKHKNATFCNFLQLSPKKPKKTQTKHVLNYECEYCGFITDNKKDYEKHLLTLKHKNATFCNFSVKKSAKFSCQNCPKHYQTYSGLWRHNKLCRPSSILYNSDTALVTCSSKQADACSTNEVVHLMVKENQKLHETIKELIPQIGNKTNIQTNNQTNNFNVNMFLNETCKDAMDISDFTKQIDIGLENVMYAYNHNVLISSRNLMVENLQNMEIEKRPMHCTDAKRNVMYIKNNGEWEKDIDNKILKEELSNVSVRHIKGVKLWAKANPMFESSDAGMDRYLRVLRANSAYVTNMPGEMKHSIKTICSETYVSKNSMTLLAC